MTKEEMKETRMGYDLNVHQKIVRYELSYFLTEMEVYVAPTSINLENPTFWLQNLDELNKSERKAT